MGFIEGLIIGAVAGFVFGVLFMRIKANYVHVDDIATKIAADAAKVSATAVKVEDAAKVVVADVKTDVTKV
jgi:hypothetical protein